MYLRKCLVIHIDHHEDKKEIPAIHTYIDVTASSTTQILLERYIPYNFVTKKIATLMYAGIVEDTGNFRWLTSSRTLRVAADLLDKGVDGKQMMFHLSLMKTKKYFDAFVWAVNHITYEPEMRTIFLLIPYALRIKDAIDGELFDSIKKAFAEQIAYYIDGFDRGILIYEQQKRDIYISVRANESTNTVDMPKLFRELGGTSGGHFHAASVKLKASFTFTKNHLYTLMKNALQVGL